MSALGLIEEGCSDSLVSATNQPLLFIYVDGSGRLAPKVSGSRLGPSTIFVAVVLESWPFFWPLSDSSSKYALRSNTSASAMRRIRLAVRTSLAEVAPKATLSASAKASANSRTNSLFSGPSDNLVIAQTSSFVGKGGKSLQNIFSASHFTVNAFIGSDFTSAARSRSCSNECASEERRRNSLARSSKYRSQSESVQPETILSEEINAALFSSVSSESISHNEDLAPAVGMLFSPAC